MIDGASKAQSFAGLALTITEYCEFECRHCYASAIRDKQKAHQYPRDTLLEIIRHCIPLGIESVFLGGGEPLTHPDIAALVGETLQLGLTPSISTNGLHLTDGMLAALNAEGMTHNLALSLDGASQESNDAVRGHGAFEVACRALHVLRDFGRIDFGINVVVTSQNLREVDAITELARQHNASYLTLVRLTQDGRAIDHWDELAVTDDEYLQCLRALNDRFTLTDHFFLQCTMFDLRPVTDSAAIRRKPILMSPDKNGLPVGISVDGKGDVQITPMRIIVGNIQREPIDVVIGRLQDGVYEPRVAEWRASAGAEQQREANLLFGTTGRADCKVGKLSSDEKQITMP